MKYPKINSLYMRDPETNKFIKNAYSDDEFLTIKWWDIYEKVDGTNIRINLKPCGKFDFYGRGDDAQIPKNLYDYLRTHFTQQRLISTFWKDNDARQDVWIFGEGYGPKIQKGGGNYRDEAGFIVFDIKVGSWWLNRKGIAEVAEQLEIPCVPYLGVMTLDEAELYLIQNDAQSKCSIRPQRMEGIIAKARPVMLFRDPTRGQVMFKLKCRDFEG